MRLKNKMYKKVESSSSCSQSEGVWIPMMHLKNGGPKGGPKF